jgi:signal transduction histidine kinase
LLSVSFERVKRAVPVSQIEFRDRMDELREQVVDISSGIHALSHELHSSKLRHLDTVNAMRGFCMELSEQQTVEICFVDKDIPEALPQEISICLFRVLQEALHNAVKHSKSCRFEVELRGTPDAICLTIRDSGVGFDSDAAMNGCGLGLTSMQERLKLVDGDFFIDSQPGRGTTINARVPLRTAGNTTSKFV